jgi:hypothetical protein
MTNTFFTTVGTTSWIVPSDWNNSNNYMAVIGGGGGPSCGGGGGFSSTNNVLLTPGATVHVRVGAGGTTDKGGNTWINILSNAQPTSSAQGILATAGTDEGSPYSIAGNGFYGTVNNAGGGGNIFYGPGGGAAGPHGPGANGTTSTGGAADAGFGGAGGFESGSYTATADGYNGTEWGSYGAGGGGGFNLGGLYGGGGGDFGDGAQGMALIFYFPGPVVPPPANTPPVVVTNTAVGGGAICGCILPVFNPGDENTGTAKYAQYYWNYGSWTEAFVGGAHYDSNYKQLLSLETDNDSTNFDNLYDNKTNWSFINEQENKFNDFPRIWKSRSNEWVDDAGQRSIWMRHRVAIANSLCLPDSEPSLGYVTCATNLLFMDEQTYGWKLTYTNQSGFFNPGDVVFQSVSGTIVSGTVFQMDPNFLWINIPVGKFFAGSSAYNPNNPNINVFVTDSVEMNEKYTSNVFIGQSRYITKSTILAPGQDAEDLQVFMGAYRPANTNFKVYGKVISGDDYGLYNDRIWSRMFESGNTSTKYSSSTNLNDFVDLVWYFPTSQLLFGNISGCACSSNSLFVYVPSSNAFYSGLRIYLSDPSVGSFNVRTVAYVVNSTYLQLLSTPSFSNTSNLNVGIIPGLEDTTASFLYDQNSNAMRYVTNNDIYFDSFDQFATKIVPTSDNPVIVPRATDLRVLALQV